MNLRENSVKRVSCKRLYADLQMPEVADVAVLFATGASIFDALALLCAVREFRRRARASFSHATQSTDIGEAPGKVVLRVEKS
jgi:hypothetical protein